LENAVEGKIMADEKFYITTAIDYVNQKPHLGTAYEKIGADCMARYKRLCGYRTYFLMGNDEHSTNVEKEARRRGMDTQKYCDKMSNEFRSIWGSLNVSYDDFIHTSEDRHVRAVKELFRKIDDNGYIYKGKYEGLYCESCEEYISEKDLEDGLCPRHKEKPKLLSEENYFFKLSGFGEQILRHIRENPGFIQPVIRENEIVNVIESGLEDVSVSRAGKRWGIPIPGDDSHVVYVWFDALINYISALGYGGEEMELFNRYWPANIHVVGKDITRFHCIIWPAMLMAAGVELPGSIFAHGFISLAGEKMSKTRGNILDPDIMKDTFGSDGLRYLLLREVPFDKDGDISVERLVDRYNSDLANELGNLFSRTTSMISKYFDGNVRQSGFGSDSVMYGDVIKGLESYSAHMERLQFSMAINSWWAVIQRANKYIEEKKPWKLAGDDEKREQLSHVFTELLAVLQVTGHVLMPFMPVKMEDMLNKLGVEKVRRIDDLPPGKVGAAGLKQAAPLFPRIIEIPGDLKGG
jgi:methionyl-tRNA synthetase